MANLLSTTIAGSLTVDTNVLYVDSTNNLVGIGTTSPSAKLEIAGFSTGAGLKLNYGNSSGTIEAVNFIANGGANGVIGMQMVSAGVGDLWLGGSGGRSLTLYRDGNVGIGTTSPSYKLDVSGQIRVNNGVGNGSGQAVVIGGSGDVTLTSGGSLFFGAYDYGNSTYIRGYDNSSGLYFYADGTLTMNIAGNGNVGIGTTSAAYPLHIDSSTQQFRISGNTNHLTMYSWADGVNVWSSENLYFGRDAATANKIFFQNGNASTTTMYVNTATERVGIGTTAPAQKLHVYEASGNSQAYLLVQNNRARNAAVYTKTTVGGFYAGTSIGTDTLCYQIYDDTAGERMRITSGGSLLIGDTTQAYNPQTQGYLFGVKSNTTQTFISIAKSGQTLDSGGMIVGLDSTTGYILMRESTDLTFATNNTTRVTIAAGGNVGIGNSSPQANGASAVLDVGNGSGGTLNLRDTNTGLAAEGFNQIFGGDNRMYLYAGASGASSYMQFYTNDVERMRITSAGNVGIGTTSPDIYSFGGRIVTVNGGSSYTNLVIAGDIDSGIAFGTSTARLGQITMDSTNGMTFFSSGSGNGITMTLSRSGNVGIGTASPGAKLEVADLGGATIKISNRTDGGQTTGDLVGALDYYSYDADYPRTMAYVRSYVTEQFGRAADLRFATTSTNAVVAEAMRITSGGNVGIGTTNPGAKLDVVGVIRYGNDGASVGALSYGSSGVVTLEASSANTHVSIIPSGTGNVGIGTTSPSAKLEVGGASTPSIRITSSSGPYSVVSSNTVGSLEFSADDGNTGASSNINFKLDGSNVVRITSGGNVGIGTTAPNRRLHVVSSDDTRGIMVEQTLASSYAEVHFKASREYRIGTGGSTSAAEAANNWYVYDATAAAQRFVITSAGNVGIGTTTPASELDVNGTVNANIFSVMGTAGYTGVVTFPGNPPGMQNLDFQGGILVNVF